MNKEIVPDEHCTPEQFGELVQVPAHEVHSLVERGVLPVGGTYAEMTGAYIKHLTAPDSNPYPPNSYRHRVHVVAHLDVRCTQAAFGKMVGISQPAVSGLIKKGVLHPEGTALAWLRDYQANLLHQIAYRGST